MKRFKRLFIFTVLLFVVGVNSVLAKKMSIDELGSEALKINSDLNYIYIIGKYAFTDQYGIDTADLMLAAKSIYTTVQDGEIKGNSIYDKMTIQKIHADYKIEGGKIVLKGWIKDPNVIGKTNLEDNIDIRYIDYNFYPEETKFEVKTDLALEQEYKDKLQSDYNYSGNEDNTENLRIENNKVKGLVKINSGVTNFGDAKTDYYFAFVIKVPNVTDDTTIKLVGNGTSEAKRANFDTEDGIVVLWAVSKNSKKKTIDITVDLDGDKNEYKETTYTLDWSELEFQTYTEINLNSTDIPQTDIEDLKKMGYIYNEGEYSITSSGDDSYNLTGNIQMQHTKEYVFSPAGEDGYYFAFSIKKPDDLATVPDDVTLQIKGQTTNNFKKDSFNKDGVFTNLFKLNELCGSESCKFTVKIDWDGPNKQKYLEKTYTINYEGVTFVKSSRSEVVDISKNSTAKDYITSEYGWEQKDGYSVEFNEDENNNKLIHISGVVPILEDFNGDKEPFESEHKTGYYIPFVLKTNTTKKTGATVKAIFEDESENKTLSASDFNDDDEIYILMHLHSDKKKSFKIEIDLDGPDNDEYAPYELTFDYSSLIFQKYSSKTEVRIAKNTSTLGDPNRLLTEELEKYSSEGYNWELSSLTNLTNNGDYNYQLEGTLKYQHLNRDTNKDGYFAVLKIMKPNVIGKDWKVKVNGETFNSENKNNTLGYIPVLFKVDDISKKIEFEIDFDGDGNEYLPITQEIDCSNINFIEEISVNFTDGKSSSIDEQKVYKGEYATPSTKINEHPLEYHEFSYWMKDNSEFKFNETPITEATTLNPHYILDVDAFVNDVIRDLNTQNEEHSANNYEKYEFSKNNKNITVKVKEKDIHFDNLYSSSVKGALSGIIDYILNKDEITKIKLSLDGSSLSITKSSKEEISGQLDTFFNSIKETNIDELALDDKTFTIEVEELNNNNIVELKDKNSNTYTIGFETDFVIANSKDNITSAIENLKIKTIYLNNDIVLDNTINVANRQLTIMSNDENKKSLSVSNADYVIEAKGGILELKNITLKGATISGLHVIGTDVTASNLAFENNKASGVTVEDGGKFTANNLTNTSESYDSPTLRATSKASITLNVGEDKNVTPVTYQEVERYETSSNSAGDQLKSKGNYQHYYLNDSNKNGFYKITYYKDRDVVGLGGAFIRYYKIGDSDYSKIYLPENLEGISKYSYNDVYNYSLGSGSICTSSERTDCKSQNSINSITGNTEYWIKLEPTPKSTVKTVENLNDLTDNIDNTDYNVFVLKNNITLKSPLTINRNLIITGEKKGDSNPTLKGQLIINAASTKEDANTTYKVQIKNIKLVGNNVQDTLAIVTVKSPKTRFLYDDFSSEETFDTAIKFDLDEANTALSYNNFDGTNLKSFIDFKQGTSNDTNYGNTYKSGENTDTQIYYHSIKENDTVSISGFRPSFNNDNQYAVKIDATDKMSGKLKVGDSNKFSGKYNIGFNVTGNEDLRNFNIENVVSTNVVVKYLQEQVEYEDNPKGKEYNVKMN